MDVHYPKPSISAELSVTASEFLPAIAVTTPELRPYPPGIASDGVEWSVSDAAWMALQYGKEDVCPFSPQAIVEPDIADTKILKALKVKLPNGGIFDDKVLPAPASPVLPNSCFSKEYFLNLHYKVRQHGTYNYGH